MLDRGEPGSLVGMRVAVRPPDLIRSPTSSRRWAGIVRRRLRSPRQSGELPSRTAGSVLGHAHPLPRSIDAVGSVGRQWRTCAAVLAGALIAQLERRAWAIALTISAGLVLLTLTMRFFTLRQRVRDEVIHLIAEGHEALPIAAVQRQRQQLLSQRTRGSLARTIEKMLNEALSPPRIMMRGARERRTPTVQHTRHRRRRTRASCRDRPASDGEDSRPRRGADRAATYPWRLPTLRSRSRRPSRGASPHIERA